MHGDWASIDSDGFWFIHGRSDDTLKVAGKRAGPAEVEGAAVAHAAVLNAAAISVPRAIKGEAIVVLYVVHPDAGGDAGLRAACPFSWGLYPGASVAAVAGTVRQGAGHHSGLAFSGEGLSSVPSRCYVWKALPRHVG